MQGSTFERLTSAFGAEVVCSVPACLEHLWGPVYSGKHSGTCKMKRSWWHFHECSPEQRVCWLTQEFTNSCIFSSCINLLATVSKTFTCISSFKTSDCSQPELTIGRMGMRNSLSQVGSVPVLNYFKNRNMIKRLMSSLSRTHF